jgi:alpha-beta hydrolase superfamily lysophospholipase
VRASNYYFTSDDGRPLYLYKWAPDGSPRAIVHVVHGLAEHGARYDWTARRLCARGYLVMAHDQRGHGRTAGSPESCGNLAERGGWNRAVQDIRLLLEADGIFRPARYPSGPLHGILHGPADDV